MDFFLCQIDREPGSHWAAPDRRCSYPLLLNATLLVWQQPRGSNVHDLPVVRRTLYWLSQHTGITPLIVHVFQNTITTTNIRWLIISYQGNYPLDNASPEDYLPEIYPKRTITPWNITPRKKKSPPPEGQPTPENNYLWKITPGKLPPRIIIPRGQVPPPPPEDNYPIYITNTPPQGKTRTTPPEDKYNPQIPPPKLLKICIIEIVIVILTKSTLYTIQNQTVHLL